MKTTDKRHWISSKKDELYFSIRENVRISGLQNCNDDDYLNMIRGRDVQIIAVEDEDGEGVANLTVDILTGEILGFYGYINRELRDVIF